MTYLPLFKGHRKLSANEIHQKEELLDKEVENWLLEITKLYEKDGKIEAFEKEKQCLRAYLIKLQEETKPFGKLSMCKLEGPYRRGGTAIVFMATHTRIKNQKLALKFNRPRKEGDTLKLIENELDILPKLEHSNIIKVLDVEKFDIGSSCPQLLVILEPFIVGAHSLREYAESLSYFGKEITADLLDASLFKLILVLRQWVEALNYIHESGYVYLDVKPDNAIVDKDGHLVIIDFGTTQRIDPEDESPTEIFFSEPYAHPRIKRRFERTSTNRVRAAMKRKDLTFELDYYALGKSILELLEIISINHPHDFPQRPLFRSLHFLATRLLDGQNKKTYRVDSQLDKKVHLDEVFDGLTEEDYTTIKYENLKEVIRDLNKELGSWDPENIIPELKIFPSSTLRVIPDMNTALSDRLVDLIEHPLVARLKLVSQLGLATLVYPTADHSRYDHILGSYTYTRYYIMALFNDSQNCMFRNLINEDDIKAALLASMLHDLGQYPLAHDLQEVHPRIFDHTNISIDLLSNETKDKNGRTLRDIIEDNEHGWGVELERVKRILGVHSGQVRLQETQTVHDFKADMLSALIDGPIDADKADYIIRDSTNCRLPYGKQLDIERLLSVLTTVRIPAHFNAPHKVTIGIYEKGMASASAFSLARYLLFASVYWHHTSRILKTMLQYATVLILPKEVFGAYPDEGRIKEIRAKLLEFITLYLIPPADQIQQETRSRRLEKVKQSLKAEPSDFILIDTSKQVKEKYTGWYPGICRTDWLMLNWIKELSGPRQDNRGIALINLILQRNLYKRVYTIHRGETSETDRLIERLDDLEWLKRVRLCEIAQDFILEMIRKKQTTIDTHPYPTEDRVEEIFNNNLAILFDIPNYKRFLADRPLIYVPELQGKTYYDEKPTESRNLSDALNYLMKSISPIRVLCHPELRQWIGACISPDEMRYIINSALEKVQ